MYFILHQPKKKNFTKVVKSFKGFARYSERSILSYSEHTLKLRECGNHKWYKFCKRHLHVPVVYFDQHLVAVHSKCHSKSAF